jgi:predicted PurR-regulated permease PerM
MAGADRDSVPPALVFRWAVAGTAGVLAVLLVAYGVYAIRAILVLVLIALFVAISLYPVVRWLAGHGVPHWAAVTIVVLALVALFVLLLWSIVPPVVDQSGRLFSDLPGYLRKVAEQSRQVREFTDRYQLTDRLTEVLGELPGRLAGGAVGFVQRFLGALASSVTILVLAIYFLVELPRLQRAVVELFPPGRRGRVAEIVEVVVDKVGGYMIGNIIVSLLAGLSAFVCLQLVGVPFALPLAVIVGIADLIPLIGAAIGAVACLAVSLLAVGVWPGSVVVLIFFIAYQQVENYLIVPRVMRNTVDMPAMAVLVVALIGGTLLGLVGAVMAIPIAATVKVALSPTVARMRQAPDDHKR